MELLNRIVEIDLTVMALIAEIRGPLLTKLSTSVTGLGTVTAALVLLRVFYLAGWKQEFRKGMVSHSINGFLVLGLMMLVNRPYPANPVCMTAGEAALRSFPSGHAASAGVFSYISYVSDEIPFMPAAILVVLLSFSRIYLGTHYLSDTIFGLLMGICVTFLVYRMDFS